MSRRYLSTPDPYDTDYLVLDGVADEDEEEEDLAFLRPLTAASLPDEAPLGDVPPSALVHDGNVYLPSHSTDDYDVYEIQRVQAPFYDRTTNRDDYPWQEPTLRIHPSATPEPRVLPRFEGETTNQATYPAHVPVKRTSVVETPERRAKVPFVGESTARAEFTPKQTQRPSGTRPKTSLGAPGSFQDETENRVTYNRKVAPGPPTRFTARDNLGVGGTFSDKTTTKVTFPGHLDVRRPQRRRRSLPVVDRAPLEAATTHRLEFTPKQSGVCPAAKLLATHRAHRLPGRVRDGHFFVPVDRLGRPHPPTQPQMAKKASRKTVYDSVAEGYGPVPPVLYAPWQRPTLPLEELSGANRFRKK